MDDQIIEAQDDRLSFLESFHQLIQYAQIDQVRKEYFLSLLTEARYNSMSTEDAYELMEIVGKTQDDLEAKIIDSDDIELINNLTDMKEFMYKLMNEAEESGYKLILGDKVASQKSGQWLLDKFAGLSE